MEYEDDEEDSDSEEEDSDEEEYEYSDEDEQDGARVRTFIFRLLPPLSPSSLPFLTIRFPLFVPPSFTPSCGAFPFLRFLLSLHLFNSSSKNKKSLLLFMREKKKVLL